MFEQWMETNGFTEQIYDNTVAASAYLDAIEDAYYGENGTVVPLADQVAKFNEDYVCAKHVLISSTDDEGNELTGDALTEAQAKANEVLEKAKSGTDFDTLIAQYNEDPGMQYYPDGYVFTEGKMDHFGEALPEGDDLLVLKLPPVKPDCLVPVVELFLK